MLELGVQAGLVIVGILGILVAAVLLGVVGETIFSRYMRHTNVLGASILSVIGFVSVGVSWLTIGWWSLICVPVALAFGVYVRKIG